MFTILTQAFRRTAQNWPVVLGVFFINFALGLIIAFPSFSILRAESQQSLAFEKLVGGFDFTVFYDFMHKNGKSLTPLLPISLGLSLLYSILNVLFAGGIISQFALRNPFRLGAFLQNSWQYFLRFLGVFLLQIFCLIIILIASALLFSLFDSVAKGSTEPTFAAWMILPMAFAFFYITYVLNVGDYARILLFRDELLNPIQAFWKAIEYVFRNLKAMQVYWAVMVLSLILSLIYLLIESRIGMTSGFKIILMFVVQQAFIFGRIFIRIWQLSNAFDFVSLRPIPLTPKTIIIEHKITEETIQEPKTDEKQNIDTKLSE
ncbi:hypothetical protein Emtol_1473 [Emticicia oligotrophica DSM 17448]|uniref:YihY/virulence factor BrkB family protein n=1 Tax=Emticicia oligotrophica (strain DSM 17448 / CIP 109782 / MTCC 6937 / GPTSA100-15) TaxID=929562 RepID=A0ABN4AK02_EMTOG|nr:hypothetical protein [Emticicia oligotrophica]AFK02619.1 hypothetical protein Emtol_1473 [Emticicia oligotrophica DSM 17448]